MSVSPADFELYSRVTGSPLPRSPQEQMRMAPHVYNFIRHNQYAQTKREPSTLQKAAGFLGKAALVGAGLGALYGASDVFGRGSEPSTTSVPPTSDTGGEAIDLNYEPEYQSQGDAINISSTPQINISPGYESQYEPQGDLIAVSQNEVPTQQGADIPAASFQGDPNQYVVGAYPLASSQTEYPPNKYFSPRGDYNDPENIIFGLPTNKAGRTQLSKFINTLHIPQINEELIDDNSQLVDHPDKPPGEVPHTPDTVGAASELLNVFPDKTSRVVDHITMYPTVSGERAGTMDWHLREWDRGEQQNVGSKPYTYNVSDPLNLALQEMAEEGSLQKESFGKLFNMAKRTRIKTGVDSEGKDVFAKVTPLITPIIPE